MVTGGSSKDLIWVLFFRLTFSREIGVTPKFEENDKKSTEYHFVLFPTHFQENGHSFRIGSTNVASRFHEGQFNLICNRIV